MPHSIRSFVCFLGLLALCFLAAQSQAAPVFGTIQSVTVTGSKSVTADQVLAVTRVRAGDALLAAAVNEDLKSIWKMGLFSDVQVLAEKVPGRDGQVSLTFAVTERPTVQEVRFFGNKEISDSDLKDKVGIKEDSIYEPALAAEAVDKILVLYREKDYYAAEVKTEIKRTKSPGKVILNVNISEGVRMKIRAITVTGNKVFSESKIKGELEDTKEVGWFNIGGSYDRAKLEADLRRVLVAYYKEGYVKAKLEGYTLDQFNEHSRSVAEKATQFLEDSKEISISFSVEEGAQYKVGALALSGNTVYNTEQLMERIDTRPGDLFDRERWDKDLTRVRQTYAEKGYIYANPNPKYTYQDEAGKVDVSLEWQEGSIAYIEGIKIRGNDVTKDKVIRRELLIHEGEAFDSTKIARSRERVFNLGFFDNVGVDVEPGSEMDKQVLVFDVSPERKTGTLSLGAGYSSVESLVGYLQVTQNNLFGNAQSVSAMWEYGQYKSSYSLSFTEPWLFDTPTSFGVDLFNTLRRVGYGGQQYALESTGGALRLGRILNPEWKVYNTYRYSQDNYFDVEPIALSYITPRIIHVSSITPSLVYDTRDNVFDASRGLYNVWSTQLAGGYLGGDQNFVKPVWDSSVYFSTPAIFGVRYFNKFILGLHGKVGKSFGFDAGRGYTDVPLADMFYVGGTDTVRGYEERSIGGREPNGGDHSAHFMLVSNIEYGFRPWDPLKFRLFYDSGYAWWQAEGFRDDMIAGKTLYLAPSTGFGFLFTIPTSVIQIRLDWGYPLVPDVQTRQGGKIHFNIGNIF
jgi:outer membrane protein insertion porin family